MNLLRFGTVIAVSSALSACATVTRGTKETFRVVSEPTAADVKFSTGETCSTPCAVKLKRKAQFVVTVSKPGFEPVDVPVRGRVKGGGVAGAAGNVLVGGIIGGIVDGSNGSMMDLTPNPVNVTLKSMVVAPAPAAADVATPAPTAATTPAAAEAATPAPTAAAPEAPKD